MRNVLDPTLAESSGNEPAPEYSGRPGASQFPPQSYASITESKATGKPNPILHLVFTCYAPQSISPSHLNAWGEQLLGVWKVSCCSALRFIALSRRPHEYPTSIYLFLPPHVASRAAPAWTSADETRQYRFHPNRHCVVHFFSLVL